MLTETLLQVAIVGSEWVLWALVVLSIVSIWLILERYLFFRRNRCDVNSLVETLGPQLDSNDVDAVDRHLAADTSVEAAIARQCLPWLREKGSAMETVLAAAIHENRSVIERGSVFLGTLGNNAPFVGLFGTVLGVVEAFHALSVNAMGSIDAVMSGIGEALVATGAGIFVALPAVIAFNYFSRLSSDLIDNARVLVNLLVIHSEEQG